MLKAAVLLSLCSALPAFATPTVRVADISVPGVGSYKVEMTIENQSVGGMSRVETSVRNPETQDDAQASCTINTHFSGPTIVYKLKSMSGAEVAAVTQASDIENRIQTEVATAGSCRAPALNRVAQFYHADQFVDLHVTSGNGTSATISVSAFFNGSLVVARDGSSEATLNVSSLSSLRYFVDNQGGGSAQLVDPSAPPAPAYDPANDSRI
jgi:hypothetical protein